MGYTPKQCIICVKKFIPKSPTSKVCSEECRQAAQKKRAYEYNQRPEIKERNRKYKNELYQNDPEFRERVNKNRREKRTGYNSKNCIICGAVFVPTSGISKVCSKPCGTEQRRRQAGTINPLDKEKVCIICGVGFFPRSGINQICSDACRKVNLQRWNNENGKNEYTREYKRKQRLNPEWVAKAKENWQERYYNDPVFREKTLKQAIKANNKRRALKKQAINQDYDINYFLKQNTCYICGERGTEADPITFDHRDAVNNGGADAGWNGLPAHKSCNSSKHIKPIEGQQHLWVGLTRANLLVKKRKSKSRKLSAEKV